MVFSSARKLFNCNALPLEFNSYLNRSILEKSVAGIFQKRSRRLKIFCQYMFYVTTALITFFVSPLCLKREAHRFRRSLDLQRTEKLAFLSRRRAVHPFKGSRTDVRSVCRMQGPSEVQRNR